MPCANERTQPQPSFRADAERPSSTAAAQALHRVGASGAPVLIARGERTLVPIAAREGGARFWAFEVVAHGNATYVFRPMDDAARDAMMVWAADESLEREGLLQDRELQRELGFVDRVVHADGEGALAEWSRQLVEKLL